MIVEEEEEEEEEALFFSSEDVAPAASGFVSEDFGESVLGDFVFVFVSAGAGFGFLETIPLPRAAFSFGGSNVAFLDSSANAAGVGTKPSPSA